MSSLCYIQGWPHQSPVPPRNLLVREVGGKYGTLKFVSPMYFLYCVTAKRYFMNAIQKCHTFLHYVYPSARSMSFCVTTPALEGTGTLV